jgi:hypothetical protein
MAITIEEQVARAKLAQHCERDSNSKFPLICILLDTLPSAVKLALDADVQQGSAFSIVVCTVILEPSETL